MAEKRRKTASTSRSTKSSGRSTAARSGGTTARNTGRSSSGRRTAPASGARGQSSQYGRTAGYAAKRRRQEEENEMQRDIFLVLLFAGMVFLFLSNFGVFGIVGHFFQTVMMGLLGSAAYLLPVVIFGLALYGMMNRGQEGITSRIVCLLVMYLVITIVCELVSGMVEPDLPLAVSEIWDRSSTNKSGGGVVGGIAAWILMRTIRTAGTILVLIVISVICLVVITGKPLLRLMQESAVDARDRARYRREAEEEYRAEHPEEYEGFLPDDEDDEEAEDDIAAYRAQREARMREEARRSVERRHETKKEAIRTFRGIIGDTNLSNDPYVRKMQEEKTRQHANDTVPNVADDCHHEESLPQEEMETPALSEAVEPAEDPSETVPVTEQAPENPTVEMTAQSQDSAMKIELPTDDVPETPEHVLAARRIIQNQRPGTDGIQLTLASVPSDQEELETDRAAVRESVRQAIPIHRESNNLHEINVLEFQGSYAALARNTMQSDEDDEDLTSRIIREGMADLMRDEPDETNTMNPEGSAQQAAADAFRSSNAFTEIQSAYSRNEYPEQGALQNEEPSQADREDTISSVEESSVQGLLTAVPETQERNPDSMDREEHPGLAAGETEPLEGKAPAGDPEESADPAVEPMTETRDVLPTVDPVREMTTPAGSGSAIAAEHARKAMIHTEDTAQREMKAQQDSRTSVVPQKAALAKKKAYVYPPLSLLTAGNPSRDSGSDEELRHTAEVLETTLHTFGVNCKITDISQGPAVTRYELLPEQGVKVSKVVGLSDDIKLALAAMDIRIEAPIPGKSAIGIEVPNKVTSTVALRDILSNPNFVDHKSKLAIGIGKDISGQIVVSDLAKMPHVLIAGATGSGKSVCINTIIMSILYHAAPEEVKLLMIDPKVVELSVYNGIPHLLYPVVTNPQQAATLLNWAVAEMEARYRKFADAKVRDMKGYNQMIQQQLDQGRTTDEDGNALRVMPRIVVIVDELADLMMVARNDVETAICRLAQLARAAGIHLIIATQRPSVDVITGLIKANMPSRIAFAVSSGVDSRTILDMNGAEKLLGKGDMLFFPQGLPKPARIQGAFVTDDEVSDVVNFIREQDPADTEEEAQIRQQMENLGNGGPASGGDSKAQDSGSDIDDYFHRAGKFIIEKDNASIGLLQRGFRIGFNRAARLMDQLCDAGVVAESEGTKSRRILMTEAEFEDYCRENDIH